MSLNDDALIVEEGPPDGEEINGPENLNITLLRPEPNVLPVTPWTLVAHNRRVLAGWEALARNASANARHCFDWLSQHPTSIKPKRFYPLKGKPLMGCWAYEIGSGDRVYYKPIDKDKKVLIYYAGPHPPRVPLPPRGL